MLKILVANQNNEQNLEYCKFLANRTGYNIQSCTDGKTTLLEYKKEEPNILILDSNFNDINCTDLINKITSFPNEKNKCNIILTVDSIEQFCDLENVAKINQILYKPINHEKLIDKIDLMKQEFETMDILDNELNSYLLQLSLNVNSIGCKYLKCAILNYYYYSKRFNYLEDVFITVASEYNVTKSEIREGIRSALIPLNIYRDTIQHPIMKLFDTTRNITPKYFLEFFVIYLKSKKNKK